MEAEGCELFGVAPYGGGLWHTWFDRGLGVAGRVTIQDEKGLLVNKLVRVSDPLCYIPNLCIHLQTADELRAFQINKEDHLRPVVGTVDVSVSKEGSDQAALRYSPTILKRVAETLGIDPVIAKDKILSWDLCLFDSHPSRVGGANGEFLDSQGLDNRSSVFANFKSLVDTPISGSDKLFIAVAFDHEEVGSQSNAGAGSRLLQDWLIRLLCLISGTSQDSFPELFARSVIVSCDAAHAVHPNYSSKHQAQHKPHLQAGVVVKVNANQRYATTAPLLGFVRQMAMKSHLKIQEIVVKNDSPCGGTIGPMSSAATLIQTIDCGIPIWAMHSIRELGGLCDIEHLYRFGNCFYEQWTPCADALPPVDYGNNV